MSGRTISIKGFVFGRAARPLQTGGNIFNGVAYDFWDFEPSESLITIPHTLTFTIPEGFDPTGQMIAGLEAQRKEITDAYHAAVKEINTRISKLQALEYTAPDTTTKETK